MNQWNENSALKALNGNVHAYNKQLSGHGGLYGLRACSAFDYLCDHCGYQSDNMEVETSLKNNTYR